MKESEIGPRVKLPETLIETLNEDLGKEKGDQFAWLWAEYLHVRMCVDDLKNGFGGDKPPMNVIWGIAPEFAKRYRNLLIEAIVLGACRLTDKHKVSGKETISIAVLPKWFTNKPELKEEMERLVETANEQEKLRTWRHRQLAHTARERERPPVTGEEAEASVNRIHKALAFVWQQRLGKDPELPHPRPTSAAHGEHLSRMHERTASFEA